MSKRIVSLLLALLALFVVVASSESIDPTPEAPSVAALDADESQDPGSPTDDAPEERLEALARSNADCWVASPLAAAVDAATTGDAPGTWAGLPEPPPPRPPRRG